MLENFAEIDNVGSISSETSLSEDEDTSFSTLSSVDTPVATEQVQQLSEPTTPLSQQS